MPTLICLTCLSASSTKLCMMIRRCQDGTAPQYLAVHWSPVSEAASRQHLRSAASHQLTVPPHRRTTYGSQAFSVAGPSMQNSLPKRLCDPSSSSTALAVFWKHSSSPSTSVTSALEALAMMRYINYVLHYITLHYLCILQASYGRLMAFFFNMSCLGVILQVRGRDSMSTPQNGSAAYVFSRVVSHCLPCGFHLPECPSCMAGPP